MVNTNMKIKVSYETWLKLHQFLMQNYCTSADYTVVNHSGIVEIEFINPRCFELVDHYWGQHFIVSDRGSDFY
jgi:hypothetical protein